MEDKVFAFEFTQTELDRLREAVLAYSEDWDTENNHPYADLLDKIGYPA